MMLLIIPKTSYQVLPCFLGKLDHDLTATEPWNHG